MAARRYIVPGLVLSRTAAYSAPVEDLQRDLRSLGYFAGPIDGIFGANTRTCVMALQYDLMTNTGVSTGNDGNAPVAVTNYNNGTVTAGSGVVDQRLGACMTAMLDDANFPKLPMSDDPAYDNTRALLAAQNAAAGKVPFPFLLQILSQESNQQHFQVPSPSNSDDFVTIGLDHNSAGSRAAITSRGYGIGQFTLFHHPPTSGEVAGVISDPLLNVAASIVELQEKFVQYVNGPADFADDRTTEVGAGPLRLCKFAVGDPSYMKDCVNCCKAAGSFDIVAGVTPVYAGAPINYNVTQYHKGNYSNVPVRADIPCDWPYAIRRYNGSGVNSYDYQAEVLLRIIQ